MSFLNEFKKLDLTAYDDNKKDGDLLSSLGLEEFGSGGKYHKYWEMIEDTGKAVAFSKINSNTSKQFQDQRAEETQRIESSFPKSFEEVKNSPNAIFWIVGGVVVTFLAITTMLDLVRGK